MSAPAIVATSGSEDANSYLTVAGANAIANGMIGSLAWATASADDKARALITATNGLETLGWVGERSSDTQALSWPRSGASCGDKVIANDAIPREIELATFDLAEALLSSPALLRSSNANNELVPGIPNRDLRRLKLDVMELEWEAGSRAAASAATPLTVLPHLASILGCLTTSTSRTGGGGVCSVVRS
jgi:hypothetical protein